ncbi:MAG: phosphoglucosamine mutase [Solirubrobacterales bacterium]
MAERKLFGTDGVRGVAGEFLTPELAMKLGRAATLAARGWGAERPQLLIVRDTRESGPMLEAALVSGITAAGGDALVAGVLPTPAAAVLTRRYGLDLAAVVSASHNPFSDNGIKFFSSRGSKLGEEAEALLEAKLEQKPGAVEIGRVRQLEGALDDYLRALQAAFPLDLNGIKVALDCAHGSAYRAAPAIFARLGAEVELFGAEPDGRNINAGLGATHPQKLAEEVAASDAQIGFAFDGDADRLIAVDDRGRLHDGDELIALAATHLKKAGSLDGGVAVTVMTNYGFHGAMKAAGIEVTETQVGDRYVIEALAERDWRLGGEQSGHIVWSDFAPTGDGIAAALLTLRALEGRSLSEVEPFERLPQRLVNVKIADRGAVEGAGALWKAVEKESAKLKGRGRVLVRPSGTEPLVRVMVEAPGVEECEAVCARLVAVVERELSEG